MSAIEEIAAERRRQIESEGWTPEAAPGYVARRIELAEQRELWVSHLASLAAYSEQVSDALKDAKDEIERLSRERGIVPDGWDRIVATLREFSSLRAADGDYWEADAAERSAKEIERIPAENRPMLSAAPQPPSERVAQRSEQAAHNGTVAGSTPAAFTTSDGWHDISTAPKDGTSVLLFSSGEMVVARWDADYGFVDPEGAFVAPLSDGWDRAVKDHYSDPTHWMPLPAPPMMEGGKSNE